MGTSIPESEYEERRRKAQEVCKARGFDGLVIGSRGGAMTDAYADVMYLSNHYTGFPLVADLPPYWVGRAHAVLVLPAEGDPALVVDIPDWRRDLVMVEDVRFSLDLATAVGNALSDRGLARSKLGFVGGNAMHVSPYLRICEASPHAEFIEAPDLIEKIRVIKSPRELELVRESAEAGNSIVNAMMEAASQPGTTEAEAVAAAYSVGVARGVAMYDAATASGPNSDYYAYGRLPAWTTRTLQRGEFFHVDCYGALNGYLFDFTRTCVVGGRATPEQIDVLETLVKAVETGITAVSPGVTAGSVYKTVHDVLVRSGLADDVPSEAWGDGDRTTKSTAALLASFPCHGHSFGLGWESPWLVPGNEMTIEADMCIAIEVMAGRPGIGSGKFEQDIIVHEDHVELLTIIPKYYAEG